MKRQNVLRVNALALILVLSCPVMAEEETEEPSASGLKTHHRLDGTFVNTDGTAINKSFGDLWKAFNEQDRPEPVEFPLQPVDPAALNSAAEVRCAQVRRN